MARQFIYHMHGMSKAYAGGKKVLDNINLSFYPDAKIGVLGPNGSGKSTLLKIMAGVDTDFTGEAWVAQGARVGYLAQEPQLDESLNVLGNVMMGVKEKKDIVDFVLEMHMWTEREFRAGRVAGEIARDYEQKFIDAGREDAYVYGPAHGLGLTEVEAPWMETSSEYTLKPNMTFQIDTFGIGSNFGVRWEKPVVVRDGGVEQQHDDRRHERGQDRQRGDQVQLEGHRASTSAT